MISRFIEAKPEDLRVYLEEAAGISKYKERRRETENRIENTRENLERLADHRLELEKQLEHLQRQAKAAERYKELKQEERGVKAELQAIHWSELKTQLAGQTAQLQIEENRIEGQTSELRQLELAIEKLRQQRVTDNEMFNAVQTRFYSVGAEIARLEQQLNYAREHQQQLQNDLTQLTLGLDRDSSLVASLFDERNAAVKVLLERAIKACNKAGKYIGICGQAPSDHPDLAKWLADQGIQSISLTPDSIVETWMFLGKH
jgi:chromosome segregation ATPase